MLPGTDAQSHRPDVDAALAGALVDRDWQVRQAAEDLLPHMAEPPEPLENS